MLVRPSLVEPSSLNIGPSPSSVVSSASTLPSLTGPPFLHVDAEQPHKEFDLPENAHLGEKMKIKPVQVGECSSRPDQGRATAKRLRGITPSAGRSSSLDGSAADIRLELDLTR